MALQAGCKISYKDWLWTPSSETPAQTGLAARSALEAVADGRRLRHLVIGVIGPRDAAPNHLAAAEAVGGALGALGLTMICGGKSGVMEAACKGADAAGGLAIGLLPGNDPEDANAFVGVPLPTGLREGRNMVIAKAARVLIAIGGSYGTLTEVAYGLHFDKAVIGLEGAPAVDGVQPAADVDHALELAAHALFATAPWPERA